MLRAYAGLRPLTPDSLPIVGKAPGIENLILACGHSRTGASLSLVTGKIVSELLLNGESSLDISPWSLDRFEGKTFQELTDDERERIKEALRDIGVLYGNKIKKH